MIRESDGPWSPRFEVGDLDSERLRALLPCTARCLYADGVLVARDFSRSDKVAREWAAAELRRPARGAPWRWAARGAIMLCLVLLAALISSCKERQCEPINQERWERFSDACMAHNSTRAACILYGERARILGCK